MKKAILTNFVVFTGKHLCQRSVAEGLTLY